MTVDELVVRYPSRRFGPARGGRRPDLERASAGWARWSTGWRLMHFKSEGAQTLLRHSGRAAGPDPDLPAPVRLVAPFDNILLSHGNRTPRDLRTEHRKRLFSGKNGVFPGTVLVDGFVAGTWELVGKGVNRPACGAQPYIQLKRGVLDAVCIGGKPLAGARL